MTAQNKLLDDFSKLMTGAFGVAQGVRSEAENSMYFWLNRWLAERNLANRDDLEAVRQMALKAREENDELRARVEALEAVAAGKKRPAASKRKPSAEKAD